MGWRVAANRLAALASAATSAVAGPGGDGPEGPEGPEGPRAQAEEVALRVEQLTLKTPDGRQEGG